MKYRVAIIGACFSRDMFNSKFVEDWREDFECIYFAFQTSMLSLVSSPIPYPRSVLSFESKHFKVRYKHFLVHELDKTVLNDLLSLSPDLILLDFFADAQQGVVKIDGKSYMTRQPGDMPNNAVSSYLLSSLSSVEFKALKNREEYLSLWKQSVRRFIDFLNEYLPGIPVVLHSPVFTYTIRYPDGKKEEGFDPVYVSAVNELHQEMIEYFMDNYKYSYFMQNEKKYDSDPDYIFGGAWIVHYHKEFYEDTFKLFKNICRNITPLKIKECRNNLLTNGSFKYGTNFMKFWNNVFYITQEDGANLINIDQRCHTKPQWFQTWFNDIPMNGQVSYTLCYDARVSSEIPLLHKFICVVRTFEKEGFVSKIHCTEELDFDWDESRPDEWVHYVQTFRPKGNFISVGIFCSQNGRISWKNIRLYRCNHEPASEEARGNVTEELLIGDRRLADVNFFHLYE